MLSRQRTKASRTTMFQCNKNSWVFRIDEITSKRIWKQTTGLGLKMCCGCYIQHYTNAIRGTQTYTDLDYKFKKSPRRLFAAYLQFPLGSNFTNSVIFRDHYISQNWSLKLEVIQKTVALLPALWPLHRHTRHTEWCQTFFEFWSISSDFTSN